MAVPKLNCDVVMKGGVTSGIVYPKAISELAATFSFKSIGGTSAGAIAAAATAAAEYGRRHRKPDAFQELERLPEVLGEMTPAGIPRLLSLFRPESRTEALFHTLLAGFGGIASAFRGALYRYRSSAFLWALPVLTVLVPLFLFLDPLSAVVGAVPWVLLAGVSTLLGIGLAVKRDIQERIPANLFGLCTGNRDGALTPWLHELLQRLSGKTDGPLTFGDLKPDGIDLQMMTTSLTHGRPYRLPFHEKVFFFREQDFLKLFPRDVVAWMKATARQESAEHTSDVFIPLPDADNLPVIVGTRMSLSFPLLLSAVPLWAIDYNVPKEKRTFEACWFSDGGISSDFPVHFFDSPLPGWPTFAINLRSLEAPPTLDEEVWMPDDNSKGREESWNRFESKGVMGFVWAIIEAMQNWADNTQMRLPGYRDRIAHIALGPKEGGLNLAMQRDLILALSKRGAMAGKELAARFTPGSGRKLNWENHRWVRLRSMLAILEEVFGKIAPKLDPDALPPQPGDPPYTDLIAKQDPVSYKWSGPPQHTQAMQAIAELRQISAAWTAAGERMSAGAPKPMPELRARPRI